MLLAELRRAISAGELVVDYRPMIRSAHIKGSAVQDWSAGSAPPVAG